MDESITQTRLYRNFYSKTSNGTCDVTTEFAVMSARRPELPWRLSRVGVREQSHLDYYYSGEPAKRCNAADEIAQMTGCFRARNKFYLNIPPAEGRPLEPGSKSEAE